MTAVRRKHTGPVAAPAGAVAFRLDKLSVEKGKRRRRRMKGQAAPDGVVPDMFPAAAFSASAVLENFGAGRYRVEFIDETGQTIAGTTRHFEVAEPVRRSKGKASLVRDDQEDDADGGADDAAAAPTRRLPRPSGPGQSFTFRDFLEFTMASNAEREQREELIRQRAREDAAAARAQDREFLGTIIGVLGRAPAAGGAVDTDLLRREMQLSIRENMMGIRRDLNNALAEREADAGDEDPEDPEDPPANLEEAGTRVGMRLLQELEQKTPGLLEKGLPQILEWVKGLGFKPSAGLERQIHAGNVNGAPRNPGSA